MSQPILITGGDGMLARAIGRVAGARGLEWVGVDRASCDITDAGAIERVLARHRPAVLFNAAAYTKVDLAEREPDVAQRVNAEAVGLLAAACARLSVKLVHFSTDFVFDGTAGRPYRAQDPTDPLGVYGRTKLEGERAVAASGLSQWLIVRTAWLFGHPGACFPATIARYARAGKPLRVVNDQRGSPTFVDDLAGAAIDLAASNARGIRHVVNSGQASWFDLAKATVEELGIAADLSPVSTEQWVSMHPEQARRPRYSVLDSDVPMRDWRAALADYARRSSEDATSG